MADEFKTLSAEDKQRLDKMLAAYRTVKALKETEGLIGSTVAGGAEGAANALPDVVKDAIGKGMEVMGKLDNQVTNRSRAATMAVLQGKNPITAAIDNPHTGSTEIGEDVLKKLEASGFPVAHLPALSVEGKDVYPAAGALGLGIENVIDPLMYTNQLGKAARFFGK